MRKLIDTHAYLGYRPVWDVHTSIADYARLQEHIRRTVGWDVRFIAMTTSTRQHERVARIVAGHPDLFVGATLLLNPRRNNPFGEYTSPTDLERLVRAQNQEQRSVVALKLHTSIARTAIDDAAVDPFADVAVEHDLSLIVHCGRKVPSDYTSPDMIARLLDRKSSLRLVLAHFGGLNPQAMHDAAQLATTYAGRLFLNTAGLSGEDQHWDLRAKPRPRLITRDCPGQWTPAFLEEAPEVIDQIVFGTDFGPLKRYSLFPVRRLSPDQQRQVFYENALRAFRLETL